MDAVKKEIKRLLSEAEKCPMCGKKGTHLEVTQKKDKLITRLILDCDCADTVENEIAFS